MDGFFRFLATLDPNQAALGLIVTLGITAIFLGWLIPKGTHVARIKDKDQYIRELSGERDDWRSAYSQSEEARSVITKQSSELLELSRTTAHLLDSLRRDSGVH